MSDWIRRDLEKFVNTDILNQDEELSFFGKLPKKLKNGLIRWIEENDDFLSNQQNINTNIFSKSSKILEVKEENVFFLPSIFNCVDCILKTFLEIYESVVLTTPTNPIYERFVHINRGRVIKIPFNNDVEHEYLNVIDAVRSKNAKILFINTNNYENAKQLSIEIVEEIAVNMPKIIVIDDTQNNFIDNTYTKLVLQYENIIVLKSFSVTEGFEGIDGCFLISSKDIILDISSVTTKTIIKMDSVVTLFGLLNISGEIAFKDYKEKQRSEFIEDVFEQSEYEIDDKQINSNDIILEDNEDVLTEQENIDSSVDDTENEGENLEKEEPLETKNIKHEEDSNENENELIDSHLDNVIDGKNEEIIEDKTDEKNLSEVRENRLIENDRNSLIEEFTKFNYISIFSTNFNNVYILSTIRIYNKLVDEGIELKRYNSSQGEILRLTIERTSENEKILEILDDVDGMHPDFF